MTSDSFPIDAPSDKSSVDSRQYIFSFPIWSIAEIPADFLEFQDVGTFLSGVFLPQDRNGPAGRVRYEARVLLLYENEVAVVFHPSSERHPVRIPLGTLEEIETGRILLLGWITLQRAGGSLSLPFNTCNAPSITRCLKSIESRWLPVLEPAGRQSCISFGAPLERKFAWAESHELLGGEAPLARWFQPARSGATGWGPRRKLFEIGGNLVAVTSRRVLWIEEQREGHYERYGIVGHTARLNSVAAVEVVPAGGGRALAVSFDSGSQWRVPLQDWAERHGRNFAATLERTIQSVK